jgi:hypothetical protein
MTAFTIPCRIRGLAGFDQYAKKTYIDKPAEKVAVIKLVSKRQHSTVRADASATNAFAEEFTADCKLLFSPATAVEVDDVVELLGVTLRIASKFPRINVAGKIDHYEITAGIE